MSDFTYTPTVGRSGSGGDFFIAIEEQWKGRKVDEQVFYFNSWQDMRKLYEDLLASYETAYREYYTP